MSFTLGLAVVWRWISEKIISEEKLNYDLDLNLEPLLFVYDGQTTELLSSAVLEFGADVFCSFIKDKPLSYLVNGDWVVL